MQLNAKDLVTKRSADKCNGGYLNRRNRVLLHHQQYLTLELGDRSMIRNNQII